MSYEGINCPHCGHPTGIDPALVTDESPMPYCKNCDGAIFGNDDDYDDDDKFDPCDDCDLPDACFDFGCAIKNGVRKPPARW